MFYCKRVGPPHFQAGFLGNAGFELPDRGMNTSTEPFSGEFGELALDLIDIEPSGT
jgi:hypothetical protein